MEGKEVRQKLLETFGKQIMFNKDFDIANDTRFYTIIMSFAYYEKTKLV